MTDCTSRYLGITARAFRLLFRQNRECERLAWNIAMLYPELGREWIDAIQKRAYHVASMSEQHSPLDLMKRMNRKLFMLGLKAPLEDLRDVERAIPEEWAR